MSDTIFAVLLITQLIYGINMQGDSTAELLSRADDNEFQNFRDLYKRFNDLIIVNAMVCFFQFITIARWMTLFRAIGNSYSLLMSLNTSIIVVFFIQQSFTVAIAMVLLML
jgi:hypothetical protein